MQGDELFLSFIYRESEAILGIVQYLGFFVKRYTHACTDAWSKWFESHTYKVSRN